MQVLRKTSEGVFVPLTVGGGIREFTDASGKHYSALEVASEYFRSGADKVSIGSDAVEAAEELRRSGKKSGKSSIEQISWVRWPVAARVAPCSNTGMDALQNLWARPQQTSLQELCSLWPCKVVLHTAGLANLP